MERKAYNWVVMYNNGESEEVKYKVTPLEVFNEITGDIHEITCIMKLDESN